MNGDSVFAIIPCYNEEENIEAVVRELRTACPDIHIVAVDDGSSDGTMRRLCSLRDSALTILSLPFNSGVGVAVQTGLLHAVGHGALCAVKFDGDGQHPADEIPRLLAPLASGEADLVIGSRFLKQDGGFRSTAMRRFGISLFRLLGFLLTGRTITDATSGFRAYGPKALAFAAKHYPSFDYPEPEECILFLRNGFRVMEIPVRMRERKAGKSSIRAWKTIYFMLKVGFAMIMEGVRPRKPEGEEIRT